MIVFDLQCGAGGHIFEAWFSNSQAFDDQKTEGLLLCPFCGDTTISKALMAPNIPAKANQRSAVRALATVPDIAPSSPPAQELKAMLGKIAALQADALKDSEWVGRDFERQARAMDAGETAQTPIHGQATPDQAREMIEDGIGIMPLLVPIIPPDERN
jgi:hypothetical protein